MQVLIQCISYHMLPTRVYGSSLAIVSYRLLPLSKLMSLFFSTCELHKSIFEILVLLNDMNLSAVQKLTFRSKYTKISVHMIGGKYHDSIRKKTLGKDQLQ